MNDPAPLWAFFGHARIAVLCMAGFAAGNASAQALTLEQAVQRGLDASPAVRAARAAFAAIEGEAAEARAPFWNNPEISTQLGARDSRQASGPTANSRDWGVGLSQTLEVVGRQRLRREIAAQEREAAEQNVNEVRAQTVFEVSERFVRVLSLQARIESEGRALTLIDQAARAVARRFDAGEDNLIDSNLASVEAERARNSVVALREQLIQARADLATAIQWPPAERLDVIGAFDDPPRVFNVEQLVASAGRRPLVRFLDLRVEANKDRLALERSFAYPDVTLGINHAKEGPNDARERVTMFTVAIPLPFFRRNQAGIGRARTELTQAEIERESGVRLVEAQVRALWSRRESLLARVNTLNQALLPRLTQNQQLTRRAFDAGEIGLVQLLLANRQLLEAQRDVIEARSELQLATIAIEAAAGLQPQINAVPPVRPQP